MKTTDITRLFIGARNEFEVEVVFGNERNKSPKEGHDYDEIIVVLEGVIKLERSDQKEITTHSKHDLIFIPKGTVHQIIGEEVPVKLVIIHPERVE